MQFCTVFDDPHITMVIFHADLRFTVTWNERCNASRNK